MPCCRLWTTLTVRCCAQCFAVIGKRLVDRTHLLAQMVRVVDHYIEHGVAMPELKTPRIVQVTINVTDLKESIAFYQAAFEATSTKRSPVRPARQRS